MELSGGTKVTPVVVIGDEVVVGFDRNHMIRALEKIGIKDEIGTL